MKGELTPILLIVATGSLVLAVVLTAVGLQVGARETIIDTGENSALVTPIDFMDQPANSAAACTPSGAITIDEEMNDVSLSGLLTIQKVEVFLERTASASVDIIGGFIPAERPPDTAFLTSSRVTTTLDAPGEWIVFDIPDVGLEATVGFALRVQAGSSDFIWSVARNPQINMNHWCAGTSDTTWTQRGVQRAIRVYGTEGGSATTDGGGGPDLSRISPFFFGLSWALYVAALMPTKALGLKIIEAIAAGVGGYIVWAYVADGVQRALGG